MAFRRAKRPRPGVPERSWRTETAERSYRTGCYADHLAAAGQAVPAWAWLNAMARGSLMLVGSLAIGDAPPGGTGEAEETRLWQRARKALALATMEHVAHLGCPLDELQREVLQGIELELAAVSDLVDYGPSDVLELVIDALNAYVPSA